MAFNAKLRQTNFQNKNKLIWFKRSVLIIETLLNLLIHIFKWVIKEEKNNCAIFVVVLPERK